jgi:hypothetical protein
MSAPGPLRIEGPPVKGYRVLRDTRFDKPTSLTVLPGVSGGGRSKVFDVSDPQSRGKPKRLNHFLYYLRA